LFHFVEIQTPFTFFQRSSLSAVHFLFSPSAVGAEEETRHHRPHHLLICPFRLSIFFVFIAVIKIVLCQAPAAESPAAESPDGRIRLSRPIPMNEKFWKFLFHFDVDKRI